MGYIGSPTQTSSSSTQSVNLTQVNGVAISLGQKTMANSLPIVIASDQTAVPVSGTFWQATQPVSGTVTANQGTAAALSSGWPVKVTDGTNTMPTMDAVARAGLVTLTDGTNKQTFMSTTTTSKFGADVNILSILGTAPTTVGKLDVKGADGDVFVRQSTASNLKATANMQDGSGNALTTNSTTYTAKFALDGNLLGTLGTAFSTAGKVDMKGADGDVFVRQATASNLKATVNIQGNAGAAMDAAGQNASSPANELLIGAQFNTTPTTITTGNMSPLQFGNSKGFLGTVLMDAAGNIRGANVTASNELLVNVNNASLAVTESGTWNVRIQDTSGNGLTTNSTTYTSKFGLDANLLGTLGTAFSTAGKVDVKGADGDVFVRQSTASNLKATVNILGNAAATLDATVGAGTAPTNMVAVGGLYNSTEISPTTGQSAALQLDSKGRLRHVLMDAAGNTRGQNVNANNAALVAVDQTTLGSTNGVTPVPASNSGWSFSYQSALSNTATQIKGSAGTLGGWLWLYNPNTAVTFIQVFNKASASVTLGTTAPDFVIALPGIASASATGSAANWESVHGIAMGTGITVAATTTASGSTAPANAVVATFLYK